MTDTPTRPRVLGYVRRSTDKQGISVEVQAARLTEAAELLDWDLDLRIEEAASAKSLAGRPVLAAALADLGAHRADVLAVAKLDRLCRDVADFAGLLNRAERERWDVVCMDLGVDTSTTTGRLMAHVTAAFAEMERRRLAERTREGMATIRATTGKHMGRPPSIPGEAEARIVALHREGMSASAIARLFNAEGVSKGPGMSPIWNHSHVGAAIRRAAVRAAAGSSLNRL
ncbi:recombinase family protein [uncultured Nocardioides sp.]|uniref:recombinase family protein n=1 Tax=uncultured Nocardioides sp. TaxID=198441 RepID=UPI00260B64F2|nr:recombinase family protein [uncultured Nocardioides sp.]